MKSEQSQVASIIRKEMKKHSIKGTVKSRSFAGGNAVDIAVEDLLPSVVNKLKAFADQFQSGDFDGMDDSYTYRNTEGPTASFIHVQCHYSAELKQAGWSHIRTVFGEEEASEDYSEAQNSIMHGQWVSAFVWQLLNGSEFPEFWTAYKPRVRA